MVLAVACTPRSRHLTILTTDDVHAAWFDSTYTGDGNQSSLLAVKYYVDSVRMADGAGNVLLLDAGDCLQGDNAAYYYNYVDTESVHLFSRMAAYMEYDAIAVGNHDIEAGPAVYRRVEKELAERGIPFLAGNAVSDSTGLPVFPVYKVFRRGGMKVLVLGYTNPNIPMWLDGQAWPGMHFESLVPLVQKDVDNLSAIIHPDVTVVIAHSGTGNGTGTVLEDQSLDLYKSLRGVDFIVCGHDHRQIAVCNDSIALLNSGKKARYVSIGRIAMDAGGKKKLEAGLIKVDGRKSDPAMRKAFRKDFEAVRAFSMHNIGIITEDLYSRDSYKGPCPYINLLHQVQLRYSGADISFAAPLNYNGKVSAGNVSYNDLYTIYPYENQLYVLRLTGKEIKDYLEYSYGLMLSAPGSAHTLAIAQKDDPRYAQKGWSFVNASYNFDSAAGINYTVDLRKPKGARISILGLADGTPFDLAAEYSVAMTSYRASGGGYLLLKGAGIPMEELQKRVVARHKEIRLMLKDYVEAEGVLDPEKFVTPEMGSWKYLPDNSAIVKDLTLLF